LQSLYVVSLDPFVQNQMEMSVFAGVRYWSSRWIRTGGRDHQERRRVWAGETF